MHQVSSCFKQISMRKKEKQAAFVLSLRRNSKDDGVNADDLGAMWLAFHKCSKLVENGKRIENCTWRLWNRLTAKNSNQLLLKTNGLGDPNLLNKSQVPSNDYKSHTIDNILNSFTVNLHRILGTLQDDLYIKKEITKAGLRRKLTKICKKPQSRKLSNQFNNEDFTKSKAAQFPSAYNSGSLEPKAMPKKTKKIRHSLHIANNSSSSLHLNILTKSQTELAKYLTKYEKKSETPAFLQPSSIVVGFEVDKGTESILSSADKHIQKAQAARNDYTSNAHFYIPDYHIDGTGYDQNSDKMAEAELDGALVKNFENKLNDQKILETTQKYGSISISEKRLAMTRNISGLPIQNSINNISSKNLAYKMTRATDYNEFIETNCDRQFETLNLLAQDTTADKNFADLESHNQDSSKESEWSSASNSPVDQLSFSKGRNSSCKAKGHQSMLSTLLAQREARDALNRRNILRIEQEHKFAMSSPKVPQVNFYSPQLENGNTLNNEVSGKAINDLAHARSKEYRASRDHLLMSSGNSNDCIDLLELSESLKRNLIWERQQKIMNTAINRRRSGNEQINVQYGNGNILESGFKRS